MSRSSDRIDRLLLAYDDSAATYKEYVNFLVASLGKALYAGDIKCHAIAGRLKARESFRGKLISGRKEYGALDEVTDIAGVRITTYFSSDVDRVADIIAPHFVIDERNSIDRRQTIESDKFGYLSLHYVVRANVTDTSTDNQFSSLPAEIQVRSILQHAWAEIEHDLGYKVPTGVPRPIRRKFSLAAGLLELADRMFDEIRTDVEHYKVELPQAIRSQADSVELNAHSIVHLLEHPSVIGSMDQKLTALAGATLSGTMSVSRLLRMMDVIGMKHVSDLQSAVQDDASRILAFATEWFASSYSADVVALNRGISLLFLFYSRISMGADASRVIASLSDSGVSDRLVPETARRILDAAKGLDGSLPTSRF